MRGKKVTVGVSVFEPNLAYSLFGAHSVPSGIAVYTVAAFQRTPLCSLRGYSVRSAGRLPAHAPPVAFVVAK